MRAIDGTAAQLAAEGSSPAATLMGGYYELSGVCSGWNGASLRVSQLLPDGQTYFARTDLVLTHANGVALGYLSPGQYKLTVDTAVPSATVYAALSRVPSD